MFIKNDIARSENLLSLKVIHAPTLMPIRVSQEDAFYGVEIKFVFYAMMRPNANIQKL